jgi:hypothetical protein
MSICAERRLPAERSELDGSDCRTAAMVGIFNSISATVPRTQAVSGVFNHPARTCSQFPVHRAAARLRPRRQAGWRRGATRTAELGDSLGLASAGHDPASAAVLSGSDPRAGAVGSSTRSSSQ